MFTGQTHKVRPISECSHWAAAVETEYRLTVPSSELFLKKGSLVLDKLSRHRWGVRLLRQLSDLLFKGSDSLFKCGHTIHHFLRVHDRYALLLNAPLEKTND